MKITVEVDCTPVEARQFFGLPDVQPLQHKIMAEVERRMLADLERFSPEAALKSWLTMMPQSAEQMGDIVARLFAQGFGSAKPVKPGAP